MPTESPEEVALPKGLTTIDICGLARSGLREGRRRRATQVREAIERICADEINVRHAPGTQRFRDQRDRAELALRNLVDDTPEYLALTNAMIRVFEEVRAAARAYLEALPGWTAAPGSSRHQRALQAPIARIKAETDAAQPLASFAREILVLLEVPEIFDFLEEPSAGA